MCSLLSVCGMVCELSAAAPTQCMLPNAVLPVMMMLDSLTVSSRGSIPLISYFGHGVYHRSRKVAEAVHCCQHQSWFSLKGCVTSPCICPASKHKKLLLFLLWILEAKCKNFKAVLFPKVYGIFRYPFLPGGSHWSSASLVLQRCQFCLHMACSLWVSSKSLCLFD